MYQGCFEVKIQKMFLIILFRKGDYKAQGLCLNKCHFLDFMHVSLCGKLTNFILK